MRELIRAVFLVATSSVVGTAVALLRNKLLAVLLGPAGVGLVAQLAGLQATVTGLVPMGMQIGALRYVARDRVEDRQRLARMLATAARLFIGLSMVAVVLCLIGVRPLAGWALGDATLWWLLVPAILSIPLVVQSQLWLTYVQAGLDMKVYARALMLTAVGGLATVAILVPIWDRLGAAWQLLAAALVGYGVARHHARADMDADLRRAVAESGMDRQAARNLARFAWANLPVFALTLLVPYAIRAELVRDLGMEANGVYHVLFTISTQYLAIPLSAMVAYSFPRISQLRDLEEVNREVNHALRVVLLVSTFAILGVLLLRHFVIEWLFSREFLPAVTLLPGQMVGTLLQAAGWAIQLPLLPQERFRARTVLATLQAATFVGVFFAFPPAERLVGVVWAFTLSWLVHVVSHAVYMRRVNGFRIGRRNMVLLLSGLGVIAAVGYLPSPGVHWRLLGAALALVWAALAVGREEIEAVSDLARARWAALTRREPMST
jgi:PST family polysaccharide transporter